MVDIQVRRSKLVGAIIDLTFFMER